MNTISIVIVTLIVYFALPYIWDFDTNKVPELFKISQVNS